MTSRAWLITINNPERDYLPDDTSAINYSIVQLECGENGTYHFQAYTEFNKPLRLAAIKKLWPRCHAEPRRGTAESAIAYCSKTDSRIAGPWIYGIRVLQGKRLDLDDYRDAVKRGATDAELIMEHAAAHAKYPRFAGQVRRAMATEALKDQTLDRLSIWQECLAAIVDGEPDNRKIEWWWDELGKVGKTAMARHLIATKHAFYSVGGKHADILYAYEGQTIAIFDFPRSAEEFVCYSVIETLKNGIATISKYESTTFLFPIPHVIVFANFEPDRSKLSADRWKVHRIENNI